MKKQLFNANWTFFSDIDPTPKAVILPHDAMQTEQRVPGLRDGSGSGYYPGGTYTYEKTIEWDGTVETSLLEFEGVYMKSSVLLNGERVGGHIYGYTDFYVDLTGKLRKGENKLTVIADNSQFPNSRWYSGSGIYRDVWLHTAGREYIKPDGIRVDTLSIAPAQVRVRVDAVKDADTKIAVRVVKDGETITEGKGAEVILDIPNSKLWSSETPELYEVQVSLVKQDTVIDKASERFGIRMLAWDSQRGFQVNGETVKLRGGCVHHDHGVIGAAEYDAACLRRVRIMKEAGFNAVRIAHNPASKAMLRACDELGLYVMNESFDTWLGLKNTFDYGMYFAEYWRDDLAAMVRVSYNHPSVIMYSIGNEVYLKDIEKTAEITRDMVNLCHEMDPSRAVINALNSMTVLMGNDKNPESHREMKVENPREAAKNTGLAGSQLANTLISALPLIMPIVGNERAMRKRRDILEPLDIVGFNYAEFLYDPQHKDYPQRVLCGSETYPQKIGKNWPTVMAKPWVVGDFLWTAWDYLGEAGIGTVHYGKNGAFTQPFPVIAAGCCNIDLTGEITPQGIYTAVVYGQHEKPYLAVHPANHVGEKVRLGQWRFTDAMHSWTWQGYEAKPIQVDVYSNAAEVELILNGKSLGKKKTVQCVATYTVPYVEGELKAVANGKTDVLRTAGREAELQMNPESTTVQAGGNDLIFLPIEITDKNGMRRTDMDATIDLRVEGAAELLGFGSAALKQDSLTPYTGNSAETHEGRVLAVLRSKAECGAIRVTASMTDIDSKEIILQAI